MGALGKEGGAATSSPTGVGQPFRQESLVLLTGGCPREDTVGLQGSTEGCEGGRLPQPSGSDCPTAQPSLPQALNSKEEEPCGILRGFKWRRSSLCAHRTQHAGVQGC